jgi:hypothetical protein
MVASPPQYWVGIAECYASFFIFFFWNTSILRGFCTKLLSYFLSYPTQLHVHILFGFLKLFCVCYFMCMLTLNTVATYYHTLYSSYTQFSFHKSIWRRGSPDCLKLSFKQSLISLMMITTTATSKLGSVWSWNYCNGTKSSRKMQILQV